MPKENCFCGKATWSAACTGLRKALSVFFLTEFEEQTIRFGYEGSFINSLSSFIKGTPSEFYIEALRKTTLAVISKENFMKEVYHDNESLKQYSRLLETVIT